MAVRTMQAKIKQTLAQIDREKKKEEEQSSSTKEIDILIQRYQLLEKELNIQWRTEKQRKWQNGQRS